jgi:hypothetical protein
MIFFRVLADLSRRARHTHSPVVKGGAATPGESREHGAQLLTQGSDMQIDSARQLKAGLLSDVVAPLASAANARAMAVAAQSARARRGAGRGGLGAGTLAAVAEHAVLAMSAQGIDALPELQRTIALGIAPHGKSGQYRLAVRVQRSALLSSPHIERIQKAARGEADVRYIGRIVKRARKRMPPSDGGESRRKTAKATTPWYRESCRPLQIGASVGHFDVTAGTLGGFVRGKKGQVLVLSNNHVLANEDSCTKGDAILQPGRYDGGTVSDARVGSLASWVKLKPKAPNLVDCALATLAEGIDFEPGALAGVGGANSRLAGTNPLTTLGEGTRVYKLGRTTGVTSGRVTAFEFDNVVVSYDAGNLLFDDQIEIEGEGHAPFSDGGDSGALILDEDFHAVGLLFAGGDVGGSNGLGLTYANPIGSVLANLKVTLLY